MLLASVIVPLFACTEVPLPVVVLPLKVQLLTATVAAAEKDSLYKPPLPQPEQVLLLTVLLERLIVPLSL